ncbi:MAG: hypothetical protein BGO02_07715 [Brevundimonas sp. 67-6]|nr:MAG: hypothetical protein BGO02_07715 [Brevundimonas sp. 67-6]
MSRREKYLVERIDRRREHQSSRDIRTARSLFLRMQARRIVVAAANDIENPAERAVLLRDMLDIIAEQMHPITGKVEAATAFNRVASDLCVTFTLERAVAAAEAERLFSTTKPANDEGGE